MSTSPSLALMYSWPLFEAGRHMDLGCDFACDGVDDFWLSAEDDALLAARGIGRWSCDLADGRLSWSSGVYDLFGLPRGIPVSRDEAVSLYGELSRAVMERLRAYAIRHCRGFTLDAEVVPRQGSPRWMRLVAAPIWENGRAVRLHGFKRDVTRDYRLS